MRIFELVALLSLVAIVTVQASPIEKRQWFNNPNVGTVQAVMLDNGKEESA